VAISLADEPDINVGKFQQERVKQTCKLASNRTLTAPQPPHLETANRARASTYVFCPPMPNFIAVWKPMYFRLRT